jgi:hypothetical protein
LIKTIVKLVIVVLIANATWRIGSAYIAHYKFTDSIQQLSLFRGRQTDDVLRKRIFEAASDFDIPVDEQDITLRTQDRHTIVDGAYVREIEVAPGFVYPWPFDFHVDTLSSIL